jgi:nitrogen fixation/metabolism regulation signal transduction histidine kinase
LVRLFKKVVKIKPNAEDIYITKRFDVNNIPVARVFSNTFKNAKEAGATKIKVVVTYGPLTKMDILKIIDNGAGMSKDVIENVLFKQGKSTK